MNVRSKEKIRRDSEMAEIFKSGETLEATGKRFGISKERVRQIMVERGIASEQGGVTERIKKRVEAIRYCEFDGCEFQTKEESVYCHWHKERMDKYGRFGCLVDGCEKVVAKLGFCHNHGVNFFIQLKSGNVSDLDDYLKVQLAKKLIGGKRTPFVTIRKFIEDNPEHF